MPTIKRLRLARMRGVRSARKNNSLEAFVRALQHDSNALDKLNPGPRALLIAWVRGYVETWEEPRG